MLLITVIGGMGTLYGAVVGTALFVLAETYLQDLLAMAHDASASVPVLHGLLDPERWYLWLGLLFVLSVYFFPRGIVGQLRLGSEGRARRRGPAAISPETDPQETHG